VGESRRTERWRVDDEDVYDARWPSGQTIAKLTTRRQRGHELDAWRPAATAGTVGSGSSRPEQSAHDRRRCAATSMRPNSESGRGALHIVTDPRIPVDGAWLNCLDQPTQSGQSTNSLDVVAGAPAPRYAFFGQDSSGGSGPSSRAGDDHDRLATLCVYTWTPSSSLSNVHFAIRKDSAGSADVYLEQALSGYDLGLDRQGDRQLRDPLRRRRTGIARSCPGIRQPIDRCDDDCDRHRGTRRPHRRQRRLWRYASRSRPRLASPLTTRSTSARA